MSSADLTRPPLELLSVLERVHAVAISPEQERGCLDPVQPLLQPLVGEWPHELPHGGQALNTPTLGGVIELVRDVHPDRPVATVELLGRQPLRHEMEEGDLQVSGLPREC